jgi:predicted phage terminase large subunit-like protein
VADDPIAIAKKEIASRILARRNLLEFIKRINPGYMDGWVHRDICARLERFSEAVADGRSPRLMLLMPPRHGKSEIASRNFPAWHMGQYPDHEVIACSYNVSLAMGFSRKVKQIIEDTNYAQVFPDARLDPKNQSTEEWALEGARGGYVAAGIGGPITGKGAHVLVIDDPVKNAEEADSADAREKVWEWYNSTAYTRLAPGGGILIIQTWWHDDDLAGRVQNLMRAGSDDVHVDQFEVVKYPAIAEHDEWYDPMTRMIVDTPPVNGVMLRNKGEALHPARYDLDKLLRIKAQNQGGRWWSALYQQNPVPDDGAYFLKEHFRRADIPAIQKAHVFMAWDFAISEKKQSDYTVGTVGLQDDNDVLHIAEQVRFKSGDAFFIVESILNLAERWYSPSLTIGFEDGQIYRAIEALLKKRMRERRVYPSVTLLKPITDKMARARPLQGRMQQGMVSFSRHGEWFDACRQEMLRFPAGVHDDCVDSLAWLATMAVGRQPPRRPVQKELPSWKNKLKLGSGAASHMGC